MKNSNNRNLRLTSIAIAFPLLLAPELASAQGQQVPDYSSTSYNNNASLNFSVGTLLSNLPLNIFRADQNQAKEDASKSFSLNSLEKQSSGQKLNNSLGNNVNFSISAEHNWLNAFNVGFKYSYLRLAPRTGTENPKSGTSSIQDIKYQRHAILGTAGFNLPNLSPIEPFVRIGVGVALKNELSAKILGKLSNEASYEYILKSKNGGLQWVSEAELGAQINIFGVKPYASFFMTSVEAKADSIHDYKEKGGSKLPIELRALNIDSNWQYGLNLGLKYAL